MTSGLYNNPTFAVTSPTMAPPRGDEPQLETQRRTSSSGEIPLFSAPLSTNASTTRQMMMEAFENHKAVLKACGFPGTEQELFKMAWESAQAERVALQQQPPPPPPSRQ